MKNFANVESKKYILHREKVDNGDCFKEAINCNKRRVNYFSEWNWH